MSRIRFLGSFSINSEWTSVFGSERSVALLRAELDRLGLVSKRREGFADGWPPANIFPAERST